MQSQLPRQTESVYAAEGTAAHALGELKASRHFGKIDDAAYELGVQRWRETFGYYDGIPPEMDRHTDDYVALIVERMAVHPDTQLLLEQRMDTGIPNCWGTGDAVLVSPVHVEVIDLKYGAGVAVVAEENSQLRMYGIGALETFGDLLGEVGTVYMTIFQPRVVDHPLTVEMAAADLRAWRDSIIPIAVEALGDDAHFGPSETACRWCPAAGVCEAQLTHVTQRDFGTPPGQLSPVDLAKALDDLPEIKQWVEQLETAALSLAYNQGKTIPGWKVVLSSGQRYIVDSAAAIEALHILGYENEDIAKPLAAKGIGDLEKLLGKTQFARVMNPFLAKTDGKPSLVPETDKRAAVNPNDRAAKEFSDDA